MRDCLAAEITLRLVLDGGRPDHEKDAAYSAYWRARDTFMAAVRAQREENAS